MPPKSVSTVLLFELVLAVGAGGADGICNEDVGADDDGADGGGGGGCDAIVFSIDEDIFNSIISPRKDGWVVMCKIAFVVCFSSDFQSEI